MSKHGVSTAPAALIISSGVLLCFVSAGAQPQPARCRLALHGPNLVDVVAGGMQGRTTVVIEGSAIKQVLDDFQGVPSFTAVELMEKSNDIL